MSIPNKVVAEIEQHLLRVRPDLVSYYKTFANEALFARAWLGDDLKQLPAGAYLLEVGAGLMVLSAILVCEGWKVHALEPIGEGFSMFEKLQEVIYPFLVSKKMAPEVIALPVEKLAHQQAFDFAFSVNVMEHIQDIEKGLVNVVSSLKAGAKYHFICPNYTFPYEPHFNIPILVNKKITEKILGRFIFNSQRSLDAVGTWNSLNWISVGKVRKICHEMDTKLHFNSQILETTFERSIHDKTFEARRSKLVNLVIQLIVYSKLHKFTRLLPAVSFPLMDCTVFAKPNQ